MHVLETNDRRISLHMSKHMSLNIDKIKSKENYNYAIRINEIWQLRKFKITCLSGPILCSSDIQRMVHNTEKWRNPLLMIPEKSQYNKLKKNCWQCFVHSQKYILKHVKYMFSSLATKLYKSNIGTIYFYVQSFYVQ